MPRDKKIYWNRAVFLEPETLNFWFDFIDCDEQADLVKFSIMSTSFPDLLSLLLALANINNKSSFEIK